MKTGIRDQSRLGFLDYALMGVGSGLAAFTAGMAIGRPDTAQLLATGVLGGTLIAFLIRTWLGSNPLVKVDGILYSAAIGCAIIGFPVLNSLLPEEGFARDVMMAGILAWMLVLGSAMTWRDGTLLFQAIPSVALFGLVGCYDTYAAAPYLFFGFLVCLAMLLARTNRREMLRQAVESGYFNRADAPSTPQEFPEQSPELYEDIRRGPWRWLAGPEWALASALVIVLLSRIGAPALQEAAKPITGAVQIITPPSVRARVASAANRPQESSYTVGRGPLGSLSERVLYEATLDRVRYLRTASYEVYSGRGWTTFGPFSGNGSLASRSVEAALESMGEKRRSVRFVIRPTGTSRQIPLPGEPVLIEPGFARIRTDGGGVMEPPSRARINGILSEATVAPVTTPKEKEQGTDALYDASLASDRMKAFARDASKGAKDDYDKASLIAAAIANTVKYNLNAPAVPSDQDPADFFLFESKQGYCDLFATAMTLGARAVGLPARYVIGYLPEKGDGAGNFVLREADYHAWCEVYFKNVGWVVFDATEGAEQVEGGERGSSDSARNFFANPYVKNGALGLFLIGGLYLGVRLFTNRSVKVKVPRSEARAAYRVFETTVRKQLGDRRHPGESIAQYTDRASAVLGPEVVTLGQKYERALYGPDEPTSATIADLRREVRLLKRVPNLKA